MGGAQLALVAFTLLLVGGLGTVVSLVPVMRRQRAMRRRLSGLSRHRPAAAASVAEGRLARAGSSGTADKFFARLLPRRDMLVLRLERTGYPITISRYISASAGVFLVFALIAHLIFGFGLLPTVLIGAVTGIAIPHTVTGRMGTKRVAKFMLHLPDAVDLMVRALRSGLPISEAIINAGHEVSDPVGAEFRQVESALRLGRELDDVLWDMARRLDVPEFRFLVISMSIQRETGGNLADTLATLSDMLRRRTQMKLKIKALSSEARASALVLGLLPFGVVAAMLVTSPDYIGRMFNDPRGLILCGIGLGMMSVGAMVMAKIINFDI